MLIIPFIVKNKQPAAKKNRSAFNERTSNKKLHKKICNLPLKRVTRYGKFT